MHTEMERRRAIIEGRATFRGQNKGHSSRDRRAKQETSNMGVNVRNRKDRDIVDGDNVGAQVPASESTKAGTRSGMVNR
jgi:hypothetical protein